MNRLYAGILFIIMLLNMPPFNQLGKLPFLLKHYQTHKQQDPEMTIGRFIRIHYLNCDALATDNSEHKQLPFRNTDQLHQSPSVAPPETTNFAHRQIVPANTQLNGYREQFIPNSVHQNIFRPPRA